MSGNLSGFNAAEIEPHEGFTPLPAGEYPVILTESKRVPTSAGTGERLAIKLQVLSGQFQNRILFDSINIKNPNAKCQQIGQATLSSICRAVKVLTPNDSSELHGKPLTAIVKIGKDQNGNPSNDVKGYKPRHTEAAPPAKTAAPATEPNDIEQAFSESTPAASKPSPF